MKKLITFYESPDTLQNNSFKKLKEIEDISKISVINFKVNDYYSKQRDHRIYKDVLDYCENNFIDNLYFPYFAYPEYLLAELNSRVNFNTKISIGTNYSWWHEHEARINVFNDLLNKTVVKSILFYSIDFDNFILPEKCSFLIEKYYNKIFSGFELMHQTEKDFNKRDMRNKYNLKFDDITGLYFGNMNFGKGVDILYNSIYNHKIDTKVVILRKEQTKNFDFDKSVLCEKKNIIFLNKTVTEQEKLEIFSVIDYVILPYRENYKFGSSAVFIESMIAEKPVIVPDFYPFKDVVEKYKLGLVFEAEKAPSLAEKIVEMTRNYQKIKHNALFKKYKSKIQSWNYLLDTVMGDK